MKPISQKLKKHQHLRHDRHQQTRLKLAILTHIHQVQTVTGSTHRTPTPFSFTDPPHSSFKPLHLHTLTLVTSQNSACQNFNSSDGLYFLHLPLQWNCFLDGNRKFHPNILLALFTLLTYVLRKLLLIAQTLLERKKPVPNNFIYFRCIWFRYDRSSVDILLPIFTPYLCCLVLLVFSGLGGQAQLQSTPIQSTTDFPVSSWLNFYWPTYYCLNQWMGYATNSILQRRWHFIWCSGWFHWRIQVCSKGVFTYI